MKTRLTWLLLLLLLPLGYASGEEPPDITGTYQRIAADYQHIVAATRDTRALAAAGRLTRDLYRHLIETAEGVETLSADDLHALGQCYEALGERDKARDAYAQSLTMKESVRTHLSLVRIYLSDDCKAAEAHYAHAIALQPDYPGIEELHAVLAAAHQRHQNWNQAAKHLEAHLVYINSLAEQRPSSTTLRARQRVVVRELDRVRLLAGMMNQKAPALQVRTRIKGATSVEQLRGKVLLIEFFPWDKQLNADRVHWLNELHRKYSAKGVAIVGLILDYQHYIPPGAEHDRQGQPETEQTGEQTFLRDSNEQEIPWRLGVVDEKTASEYGVRRTPHLVLLEKTGNVKLIVTTPQSDDLEIVEAAMKRLVGIQ